MVIKLVSRLFGLSSARFLLSGGLNTALTYGIYLALMNFMGYRNSYTIAYVSGIILAYVFNRFFVFKAHGGMRSIVFLPLIYVAQYLASLLILWVWVEQLYQTAYLAPLVAIVLTLPLTFILSRWAFLTVRPSRSGSRPDE